MRGAPRAQAVEVALLVLSACGLAATVWLHMDALGDTFWYLATGHWIVAHGTLPTQDPFTFTATEAPWTLRMPLAEVVFALVDARAGLHGVLLVATLTEVAALLVVWLSSTRDTARWLTLPFVLFLVLLARDDLSARGQVFGDLGFALLVVLTPRLARGRWQPPRGWRGALHWGAPVLLGSAWMTSHPSAALGWFMVPAYACAAWLEPTQPRTSLRPLLAFYALFVLGTTLTPYGPGLFFEALELLVAPSTRSIDLFGSPSFWRAEPLLVIGVASLVLGCGLHDRERLRAPDLLWLAALLLAGLTGRRYLPLLGLFTVVCLGRLLEDRPSLASSRMTALGARLLVVPLSAAALVLGLTAPKDPLKHVPAPGVTAIDTQHLPPRVFNPYHWGGYLDYVWGPTGRVFIDGRNFLFERSHTMEDAGRIEAATPDAGRLLEVYQINTVLAERGSRLDEALRRDMAWEERHRGRIDVVYVRRRPIPTD